MKDEQAKELFTIIAVAYPNFLNDERKSYQAAEKARFWRKELLRLEYVGTKKRLEQYIRTNKYEPSISELLPVGNKQEIPYLDEKGVYE